MKLSLTSTIGIVLLILGVYAGVILVQSEQDVRNKAAEIKEHKVAVCHKTESTNNPWNQIEVSENAVESHLNHGDIRGNCPGVEDASDRGKSDESGNKGAENEGTKIAGNVVINNETNNTVYDSETNTEVRYVYVNSRVDIWTKLAGIDKKVENKNYRVIFQSGSGDNAEIHIFNKVSAVPDPKGVFKSTITDTRAGTFDILIKPIGYLQKRFDNNRLVRGVNRFHFEDEEFIPGDFDNNNVLDSKDIAELTSFLSDNPYSEVANKDVFDVNSDGKIDNEDLNLVLKYFTGLTVYGDE